MRQGKGGASEGTMADREVHVYQAKLAEQAERYDGKAIRSRSVDMYVSTLVL